MKHRYLVCYDVAHPKRLRAVFKTLKGFGENVQYSIFCCDLARQGKFQLLSALSDEIDHEKDRVMLIDLGPLDGRGGEAIETLGRDRPPETKRSATIL